mmetsp:Transcript_62037/g.124379  ORF Transcript_62037/g.124379 Transcript_62037/m.124379 type:complete len:218 (+) Transcript_62037:198-851(+)
MEAKASSSFTNRRRCLSCCWSNEPPPDRPAACGCRSCCGCCGCCGCCFGGGDFSTHLSAMEKRPSPKPPPPPASPLPALLLSLLLCSYSTSTTTLFDPSPSPDTTRNRLGSKGGGVRECSANATSAVAAAAAAGGRAAAARLAASPGSPTRRSSECCAPPSPPLRSEDSLTRPSCPAARRVLLFSFTAGLTESVGGEAGSSSNQARSRHWLACVCTL